MNYRTSADAFAGIEKRGNAKPETGQFSGVIMGPSPKSKILLTARILNRN
jgi:hypothetical protein